MGDTIPVDGIMREKTFVGKVDFPATVPESLIELVDFPDDVTKYAKEMGLSPHDVRFLLGVLRGRWSLTAGLNVPDLAPKIGMSFAEIDEIVRGLIAKNYARLDARLDLYRFWIVLLHIKGIRFDVGHR